MLGVSYVKSAFVLFGVGLLACCLPITVAAAARKTGKSAAVVSPPLVSLGRASFQGAWTPSGSALFRGIPFAQPPVGSLRWKPPQPLTVQPGLHEAIQPASPCLQAYVGWNRADSERSSEDCLYLDIRTPRPYRKAHLPVLVWIHGGANWGGSQIFGPSRDQALMLYGLHDGSQPPDDPILGSSGMQIAADDTFRCPAEFTAATHAASGQRVWRFQMEHAVPGELRIDHGSELTFIFDNRPLNISVDGVRPLLQSYWVNFITRGDPNGTGLPQWPAYGGKRSYLAFTDVGPQARTALRAPICALLQRP
jgi:carboxylesterase type B